YSQMIDVLSHFMEASDVNDVYVGIYDSKTNALIYVADPDPDPETFMAAGTWESANDKEIGRFFNWDGKGYPSFSMFMEGYGWICTTGVKIGQEVDGARFYILADITLANIALAMRWFTILFAAVSVAVTLFLGYQIAQHLKRELVTPINQIAEAAISFAKDRKSGVSGTDHFLKLNIRTGDEVENLNFIMSDMEQELNEYERNLTAVTQEKERMRTELSLATQIQADMLPNLFPPFPDRPEFDIYAAMQPAKEVGGDFYDFFLLDDRHLGMIMADVSGKGVPAALFMMASMILLQVMTMNMRSPKKVLERANEQICQNNAQEMFVTVWLGVLELDTGRLVAANAGHEYPVVMNPDGKFELIKDRHGFVLGGMEGVKYNEYEMRLQRGSKLFVYTDGVPEAENAAHEQFGTDRMLEALNRNTGRTHPKDDMEEVMRALQDFSEGTPQFDDITMMCLYYAGMEGKGDSMNKPRELELDAQVENIAAATDFVAGELEQMDCPFRALSQISVAIDEIFANIAMYAYPDKKGKLTVGVQPIMEPYGVEIIFRDHGVPFNPMSAKEPDTTLSAEEREIGGLGIFLVRKTMDKVEYEYRDGENVLHLFKYF
ncbi:MAG: SpoIIE family protein phosphatase, partial [Lachnospiraceae bacterium]|nr:SpoIIE family protein phosphatase [Lachnospiraceae bacterium]